MTKRRVKPVEVESKSEEQSNKVKLTRIIKDTQSAYYIYDPNEATIEVDSLDGLQVDMVSLRVKVGLELGVYAYLIKGEYYIQ